MSLSTEPSTAGNSRLDLSTKAIPSDSHSFRTHLHHFLPKHVLFHVRLQIHVLSSVPLVSGSFGARWKLKNIQSAPGAKNPGLLNKVRQSSSHRTAHEPSVSDIISTDSSTEDGGLASADSNSSTASTKQVDPSQHLPVPVNESTRFTSSSRSSSTNAMPLPEWASDPSNPNTYLGFSPALRSNTNQTTESLASSTSSSDYVTHPRGMTKYEPLKAHRVTWEHTVDSIVKMDVHRDTKDLLPNYLKLVVVQQVVPGDPNAPQNPRFGSLRLNLAEYAGNPPQNGKTVVSQVTRRYLLSESKTNATLKLTLQLERLGGEIDYIPPPLPKGEIFAGVSGLLEKEVYKVRPSAFDFFASQSSMEGLSETATNKRANHSKSSTNSSAPLPIESLPFGSGPKTTESLIEALFNPVRVNDERKASPFTYYEPHSRNRPSNSRIPSTQCSTLTHSDHSTSGQSADISSSAASVYSFITESSVDASTSESHSSNNSSRNPPQPTHTLPSSNNTIPSQRPQGGIKGFWMRQVGSRPTTPVSSMN